MCHDSCIAFGRANLGEADIKGKNVLEVGSRNVNGSLRSSVERWKPTTYIGLDIQKGEGVDFICKAEDIEKNFGKDSFDVVISTELLEHVRDWRKVISGVKRVCKSEGIILLTTRSYGYQYHGYPADFWRYELEDIKHIFSDCTILALATDLEVPGVFIKAQKPESFTENNLAEYQLYSMVTNKRIKSIVDNDFRAFYFIKLALIDRYRMFIRVTKKAIYKLLSPVTSRVMKRWS